MPDYKGPFRWACPLCGRTHFMERDAERCCAWGIYPPTPIHWRASVTVTPEREDARR